MKYTKIREVFPGDEIKEKLSKSFGIHQNKSYVHGTLCRVQDHLFILSKTNRYSPYIDDLVIGRIVYVSSEYYKINLNSVIGILPSLSFLNASKRNKPDLRMGDYVFCKVIKVGIEPLLSCVGEGFGKLNSNKLECNKLESNSNGYIFPLSIYKCQLLYTSTTLFEIGQKYRFKGCVGLNGFIFLEGGSASLVRDVYSEIDK